MKRCVVLLLFLLLLLLVVVVGCSTSSQKNDSVKSKNESVSHFKGYGIETRTDGDKLTVKTDSGVEFTVKVLPKKLSLEQEFALEMWKEILNVRFPKKDGEHIERIKAEEHIQLLVEVLAARVKTGKKDFKDVLVSNKDIRKALSLLNETSPLAADKFVGNWDGYCSVPELNKFINYPETSSQVGVVRKMIISYSSF